MLLLSSALHIGVSYPPVRDQSVAVAPVVVSESGHAVGARGVSGAQPGGQLFELARHIEAAQADIYDLWEQHQSWFERFDDLNLLDVQSCDRQEVASLEQSAPSEKLRGVLLYAMAMMA